MWVTFIDSPGFCLGHVVVISRFLIELLCLAWKTGNMSCPAVRGVTGAHVSIAWKLTWCVGTGLHNPDGPLKPFPISGGTSHSPQSGEPGSCGCVALCRHPAGMLCHAGSCSSPALPRTCGEGWEKDGLSIDLSQGQHEGLGFPPRCGAGPSLC